MFKLLSRIALLGVIVFLINAVVLAFLPYAWADDLLRDKYEYYLASGNLFDTLFLGSSRIYRQVNPKTYDRETEDSLNTRSFNMGVPALTFTQAYQLYNRILDQEPPNLRYAVFELRPVTYDPGEINLHTKGLIYWYTPRDTLFLLRAIAAEDMPLQDKLRLSGYHLTSLVEKSLNFGMGVDIIEFTIADHSPNSAFLERKAGYMPLDIEDSTSIKNRRVRFANNPSALEKRARESRRGIKKGESKVAYNAVHLERLEEMLAVAEQHGVELVFLLPPRLGDSYETLLPLFYRLPADHRIALADPDRYPAFYTVENSFDVGHLNRKGANILSRKLASKMIDLYHDTSEAFQD